MEKDDEILLNNEPKKLLTLVMEQFQKSFLEYTGMTLEEQEKVLGGKNKTYEDDFEEDDTEKGYDFALDLVQNSQDKYYHSYFVKPLKKFFIVSTELFKNKFQYNDNIDQSVNSFIFELGEALDRATKDANKAYTKKKFYAILRESSGTVIVIDGLETTRADLDKKTDFEIISILGNQIKGRTPILPFHYKELKDKGYLEIYPEVIEGYTKAGLHLEKQKFGEPPKQSYYQPSLFDVLDNHYKDYPEYYPDKDEFKTNQELIQKHNLNIQGLDLSYSEQKALHAIQTLLTKTNYRGNIQGEVITKDALENPNGFSGYLPRMRVKPSEYLTAYGASKYKTSRQKEEYSGNERAQAFKALDELSRKQIFFSYTRKEFENRSGKTVEKEREIVSIRTLLSELDIIRNQESGKVEYIEFRPCFVVVDQIDSYFVMKPINQHDELKQTFGKVDNKLALFIDYLQVRKTELSKKSNSLDNIEITFHTLAYKLRLDFLIDQRQWKRLKTQLTGYLEKAKILGYIKEGYSVTSGALKGNEKAIFSLNPDKYYLPKKEKKNDD